MSAAELSVALIVPTSDVFSGGVERTLRLVEYSETAKIRYTAFLPPSGVRDAEIAGILQGFEQAGRVVLRRSGAPRGRNGGEPFDAVAVPTEYWWQGQRRARADGLSGPYCFDFHQLPYIGTLDILKSVGIDSPASLDLARLPFVQMRVYGDGPFLSAFQTLASAASVRSLSRLRNGRVLATTPVVAKDLASLGYRGPAFIPDCPNAVARESVEESLKTEEPLEFDGVYVGRYHPQKGFLDLPFVVARLKRSLGREVRVAVCGSTHFARHLARFRRLVESLGLERNLTILGRLSRQGLYRTMRRAKLLLYPSYVDGFSITVLESLCLGVPVVAYNIGALEMIWSRREGVFRSPVGDPAALAELASGILTDSRHEEARKAARLQSRALLEEYTWQKVVRDERRFYESALEAPHAFP